MNESTKTSRHFTPAEGKLLTGRGLDIGCGMDPIRPDVVKFDMDDGDANEISKFITEKFDYIYSSHCLEHMKDVPGALLQWWGLVKVGGHLIIAVPDEDLYEQGMFPSRFNSDHKATFTIAKEKSWSPVSYNLLELALSLPGGALVTLRLQDENYDRRRQGFGYHRPGFILRPLLSLYRKARRLTNLQLSHLEALEAWFSVRDQTLEPDTMAQILCIVRKENLGFHG